MILAGTVPVVVWIAAQCQGDNAGPHQRSSARGDHSTKTVSITRVSPASAPTGGVVLPAGTHLIDGHPTRFPKTDLGVVALQVALTRVQIGFDYDDAVAAADLYTSPEDRVFFEQRAREAVALRRQLAGVPAQGEVPPPASYAMSPIAYTLRQIGDGCYAVNVLSYLTLTTVRGQVRDTLYVGTQLVRWTEADLVDSLLQGEGAGVATVGWRVVRGSSADVARLLAVRQPAAAAPGTAAYRQANWLTISGARR